MWHCSSELLPVAATWRGWLDVLATLVADPGFQARFTMSVTPNAGCAIVGCRRRAGVSGLGAAYRIIECNCSDLHHSGKEACADRRHLGSVPLPRCVPPPHLRGPQVKKASPTAPTSASTSPYHGTASIATSSSPHVRAADWDHPLILTVTFEQNGVHRPPYRISSFFGSGYYNYDEGCTWTSGASRSLAARRIPTGQEIWTTRRSWVIGSGHRGHTDPR